MLRCMPFEHWGDIIWSGGIERRGTSGLPALGQVRAGVWAAGI